MDFGCAKLTSAMNLIGEASVQGRRVLVRCDLDVPLRTPSGVGSAVVADEFRLRACLPVLKYLVEHEAKIIVCGHLDRPGGKVVEGLRLNPVAKILSGYLGNLSKIDAVVGRDVQQSSANLKPGEILLLENLRFVPGEEENDPQFAKELASLADLYVNEAFAVSHRKHASVVGVPRYLPSYAGLRLAEEVETLSRVRECPQRPLVFVIGGAKVKTKVPLVKKIASYADRILLGGKLMFEDSLRGIPNTQFPVDHVDNYDIGPQTVDIYKRELSEAGMVVWNGPLGKFELPQYARGTRELAGYLAGLDVDVIAGGGDTLAALRVFGLRERIGFVSTGGGAMLSFLSGEALPGLEVLHRGSK